MLKIRLKCMYRAYALSCQRSCYQLSHLFRWCYHVFVFCSAFRHLHLLYSFVFLCSINTYCVFKKMYLKKFFLIKSLSFFSFESPFLNYQMRYSKLVFTIAFSTFRTTNCGLIFQKLTEI